MSKKELVTDRDFLILAQQAREYGILEPDFLNFLKDCTLRDTFFKMCRGNNYLREIFFNKKTRMYEMDYQDGTFSQIFNSLLQSSSEDLTIKIKKRGLFFKSKEEGFLYLKDCLASGDIKPTQYHFFLFLDEHKKISVGAILMVGKEIMSESVFLLNDPYIWHASSGNIFCIPFVKK